MHSTIALGHNKLIIKVPLLIDKISPCFSIRFTDVPAQANCHGCWLKAGSPESRQNREQKVKAAAINEQLLSGRHFLRILY